MAVLMSALQESRRRVVYRVLLKLFVRPLVQRVPIHESCEVIKSRGSRVYYASRVGFDDLNLANGRNSSWRFLHERVLWLFGSHFGPKQRVSRIILSCEIGRFKNSLSSQVSSSPITRVNSFVCLGTCVYCSSPLNPARKFYSFCPECFHGPGLVLFLWHSYRSSL